MSVILAVFAKEKEIEKWLAKVAIFGILKRQGKVHTVVEDTKTNTLTPVIKRKMMPDSIVDTDYYRSYNALDVSEFHHY